MSTGTQARPLGATNGAAAEGGIAQGAAALWSFKARDGLATLGRVILPLGKYRREANLPGHKHAFPIQFALGEPGVRQGQ